MKAIFSSYYKLPKYILHLFLGALFIQLINVSFFVLLNFYFKKEGYSDPEIADFISYRYLSLLLFAFPLGIYIKNRRLKPFLLLSGFLFPTTALLVIYGIGHHINTVIYLMSITWGLSLTITKVCLLPYILRNVPAENHSEAIALENATWGISLLINGLICNFVPLINLTFFDERFFLILFALIGYLSIWFFSKLKIKEFVPVREMDVSLFRIKDYHWGLILKATFPVLIIATGAGLTIPFINLFFYNVFNISFNEFAFVSSITALLVISGSFIVPTIKRRFSYKVAITVSQSVSIIALISLACTEFYSNWHWAVYIAMICFIIRQPLMNMANPMTSELVMYYVGEKNQELMSAIIAAIWSGSWFISSQVFRAFRASGMSYASIFLITAGFYALGVLLYYLLIIDFYKREKIKYQL